MGIRLRINSATAINGFAVIITPLIPPCKYYGVHTSQITPLNPPDALGED